MFRSVVVDVPHGYSNVWPVVVDREFDGRSMDSARIRTAVDETKLLMRVDVSSEKSSVRPASTSISCYRPDADFYRHDITVTVSDVDMLSRWMAEEVLARTKQAADSTPLVYKQSKLAIELDEAETYGDADAKTAPKGTTKISK